MFALFARLFLHLQAAGPARSAAGGSFANGLLECADARTGHDAHELREAARAYLRVVR